MQLQPVAGTLIIVMLINIVVGFVQEYRGEKTMEALKAMSSPTGRVIRSGPRHVADGSSEFLDMAEGEKYVELDEEEEAAAADGENGMPMAPSELEQVGLGLARYPTTSSAGAVNTREPEDIPTPEIVIGDLVVLEEGVSDHVRKTGPA